MNKQSEKDIVNITKDSNRILARFVTIGTFSGSVVNFVSRAFFTDQKIYIITIYSIFLVILGLVSLYLRNSKLSPRLITHILSLIFAAIVITILLSFQTNGGLTVWSISFICLISAIVSVDKTVMIYSTAAAISIEIYLWAAHPVMFVQLDASDYVARMGIYLVALAMVVVINNMFMERQRRNLKHIEDINAKNAEIIALHQDIYKLVSESTNDGIWSYDIDKDKQVFSQWWFNVLGYTDDEILSMKHWSELIHKKDRNSAQIRYEDYLEHRIDYHEDEYRMRTKKGDYLWIRVRIKALFHKDGTPHMIVGAYTDITPLKEKEERMQKLAFCDYLTGLPNRRCFLDKLRKALAAADEDGFQVYVVFIDLDNFKKVNDSMGHYFGDILIKEVASRFKYVVKEPNVLGRLGGDEFAVIVQGYSKVQEVEVFIQRLMNSLKKPVKLKSNRFIVSASFGISIFPEDGKRIDELLRNADTAMYRAKETGKNSYKLFNKAMEIELMKKVDIENRLLSAIENDEFYLVYQPKFSLRDNGISGFEALIRWQSRDIGIVQPMDFIPLAEETGYINTIGRWVLKMACLKFSELQRDFNYLGIISVNISPIQFKSSGFVEMIKEVLLETGFNAEYLELEITEGVFIDSFENAISIFNELKSLGVRISLDDFGTGYSSLSYLQQLPIDTLKIDKSFIRNIDNSDNKNDIVKPIIALVHNMNISVVAEGVETQEQLDYLKDAKCDDIQGFLLGRPVQEVETYLVRQTDIISCQV
ncbi:MAG: EAL domain-containing protein [Bacillota bacterium]|nr:EAL domain-containing protein [Bacillota bacterium]